MKTIGFLCTLCCLLPLSNLFASHPPDILVKVLPAINYGHVLEMATFPGGTEALAELIMTEIDYFGFFQEEAIQSNVVVSFAIGSDGQVFDILIDESIGHSCDEEVVKVIKTLPKWNPAQFGEIPICMRMRLSIALR